MERLLRETTAYGIFCGDREQGKLSHAYMLLFNDKRNLKRALAFFAEEFFNAPPQLARRIAAGAFPDVKFYPQDGKKLTADAVAEILDDCALKPVEGAKKLYVLSDFDGASPLVQNKLLKTLEEPLGGVYFLLGATSLAPVLDTVVSRVKTLEVPPFSEEQIFAALERAEKREINAVAAASSDGILGAAQDIAEGGWFNEVLSAANKLCAEDKVSKAGLLATEYGDIKYKEELLAQMQRTYFTALTRGSGAARGLEKAALVVALEGVQKASADLKFNANFQGLLYDLLLSVAKAQKTAIEIAGKNYD